MTWPENPAGSVMDERKKSMWERIRSFFRLRGGPDTTEDLENEIQELLEEGEEQGLITSREEEMINSIFDFRETLASEIMTPKAEMVTADSANTVADLVRLVIDEGYTRIPLYENTPDTIIGILHAKDLLRVCSRENQPVRELEPFFLPPVFIRESTPIIDLLRLFQEKKTHMAIVNDEFGGVRGLVTLEDVLEEIVGEIADEHDRAESELKVLGDDTILVDAKIDVEKVEQFFGCRLPEGPYESVGGLIVHRLARVPERGTQIPVGALLFTVLASDARRVKTVRIEKKK
jgi:CBS domain containing-hemolysin-like protein